MKLQLTAMAPPLVIWRVNLTSSFRSRIFRHQSHREYSRHASAARAAPRKQPPAILSSPRSGAFRPELVRFLNKDVPTILVQSSSPLVYKFGMYMLASFCLSYSAINYFSVLHDPPVRASRFVRGTYGSVCIVMALFGSACLFKVASFEYTLA